MPRIVVSRPPKKIQQRQLEIRARLWPGLDVANIWSRHTDDGFSTIPSTMPLIMSIIDDMAGQPVSSVYLDLWTRAYDESFVTLSKPREMAFHSGLTSQRAERTWKQKLRLLHEHRFIDLKSGPSGPESYALIWNPYQVIKLHHEQKSPGLREDKFNALVVRALEIRDKTFALPAAETSAAAAAVALASPADQPRTTPTAVSIGNPVAAGVVRRPIASSSKTIGRRSQDRARRK
jgi:hypothetical protein